MPTLPVGVANTGLLTGSAYTQTQDGTLNQAQTGTQQQTNANRYTAGQEALQGQVAQGLQQFLQTGTPTQFGVPQHVVDQFAQNYNQYIAPQQAYQYGEGSPTMAAGLSQGIADLLARGWATGQNSYSNAINTAAGVAFQPVGQTNNQTLTNKQNTTQNNTNDGQQINADIGGLLTTLVSLFS